MNKVKSLVRYLGYILFRPLWEIERLVPRKKNIWIFGAWYGQKYSDNSKYLYEYVLENCNDVKPIWITKSKNIYDLLKKENKPVCKSNSLIGIYFCLRAEYAILTSGVVDVNKFCLNGCKQIWLWHGMPLKKIGYCIDEKISEKKLKRSRLFNPYNYLEPYCTISSSSFFNGFLEKAFRLPKEKIWNTGLPRCDAFFSKKTESFVNQLREKYRDSIIYIYMPTFRMSFDMGGTPFSPFMLQYGFKEEEFIQFLNKENIVFLYKPHFVDSGVNIRINSDRFILLNDTMFYDLYCLLNSVDVLLTDYSSVYFDFLCTKKAMFLLPFDYSDYVNNSRGHFFNMYDEMKCPYIAKDWQSFYEKAEFYHKYEDYNNSDEKKFANYNNGKSCEYLVELLRNFQNEQ